MRFAADHDPVPQIFRGLNADPRNLRVVRQEMLDQVLTKIFHGFHGILPRQHVHCVFHRIGRQDLRVVAFGVRCLEIALE